MLPVMWLCSLMSTCNLKCRKGEAQRRHSKKQSRSVRFPMKIRMVL